MYAIVDIAGQQFKVEKDSKLYVHRLAANEGDKVEFDKVMLIDDNGKVNVGTPVIEGAMISAAVVAHVRGDKVKVFKKKRRKGYQKLNGHRQDFSEIVIEDILAQGAAKAKPAAKKAAPKKEESEDKAPSAKKETKPEAKKAKEPAKKAEKAESKAADKKDDLTKIKGIGAVYQKQLIELGYTSYSDIASLTSKDIEKIAENIDGVTEETINSDEWVKQAKALAEK